MATATIAPATSDRRHDNLPAPVLTLPEWAKPTTPADDGCIDRRTDDDGYGIFA